MIIVVNGLQQRFLLSTTEGNPAARWIQNRTLIPHVGWPYALALAKTCIEECVRNHPECQAITPYPIGAAPLPTRLIDCSDPGRLRLVETHPGMHGTYVALSYVWGEDQPHQTTEANLSSYMARIDPAILPQTILDAIHVTRALGIDLLWIDGLCIVQDSEKDIHHELSRMRYVYRHAVLTIDASSAARVSEGFLQDRALEPMPNAVLPLLCPPGNPSEQSADGTWVGLIYLVEKWSMIRTRHHSISNGKPTSHTASRGWCLQERLLSTRSLVFTTQTLQLRCHTETHNVGGAGHNGYNDAPQLPDAIFHPDRHLAPGSNEWKGIHSRWWRIVEDYTRRKLSNPSDRLVAISALAEMFAPTLGPDYLAGLWRRTLLTDLFWSCDSPCSLEPTVYHGPSWSWASTDNDVYWHNTWEIGGPFPEMYWHNTPEIETPFAEIVRCTVTPRNKDLPMGPVADASLILRSCLLPCKWVIEKPKPWGDLVAEFPLSLSPFSLPCSLERMLLFFSDVDVALLEETRMWFVPVGYYYGAGILHMRGLVVCRADTDIWHRAEAHSQRDVYRRIGLAELDTSVVAMRRDSTDTLQDSDMHSMLSQLPRVDIELV
ncbi:HET-domain-containing protein [Cubamyces sp. BRFM 1775]|nr:HET-domain-containing protein [Cubamyces sp. BRFM 1775]